MRGEAHSPDAPKMCMNVARACVLACSSCPCALGTQDAHSQKNRER